MDSSDEEEELRNKDVHRYLRYNNFSADLRGTSGKCKFCMKFLRPPQIKLLEVYKIHHVGLSVCQ